MRRLSFGRLAFAFLSGLAVTLLSPTARADSDKITFESFDKVELQGDWYPSAKTIKAPTALLIHRIGGERKDLAPVAEKLQEAGFAVLTFDLRGHGGSTGVSPVDFWKVPSNVRGIRSTDGAKAKTIDHKNFTAQYYTFLINDIAAAKYFLEKQNNARECNVNDLVVVGADDGATLAALWLYTEWDRRRLCPAPMAPGGVKLCDPEGKDIAAAVFLSLRPSLGSGTKTLPVSSYLKSGFTGGVITDADAKQKLREKTGYCFVFGAEDTNSGTLSNDLYNNVLGADKNKLDLTYRVELKKTKLGGAALLGAGLDVDDLILKYLRALKDYPVMAVPLSERFRIPVP
jgi:alpha-beta hydrolase superfamily lysophospholipase